MAVKVQRSKVRQRETVAQPAFQIRPWKPRPGRRERGDYNSQQPQQPGFPPDRGQVAMLTGAPGTESKDGPRQ